MIVMVCAKIQTIIAAMTRSCKSPQELAALAGVSVNIIYRMRRGYLVKMDSFGRVCKVLELDPADAIDFERMGKGGLKAE